MKASEYEQDMHKPLTKSQFIMDRQRKFNSCKSCLKRFDDLVMRPFMIYKYENELIAKKEEFLDLFMKEGDVWEKIYMNENYNPVDVEEVRNQRGGSVLRHIENMARRNSKFNVLKNSYMSNEGGGQSKATPKISSPLLVGGRDLRS